MNSCHAGAWDAVVTCFFIDTAHNIIEYIEIISKILKDGGVSSENSVGALFFFNLFCSLVNSDITDLIWACRFGLIWDPFFITLQTCTAKKM